MAKIVKKSVPWFLVFGLILTIILSFNLRSSRVQADTADTSVTVGNAAPTLASEREDPASTSADPTDSGTNVTFKGTGTDPNSEQYYLAICKEDSITPATDGPPTCGGTGSWCISTATDSASEASCTYQVQDADAESKAWYAFACDKHAGEAGLCSAQGQGSGDSGTPFYVNRRPTFTVFQDDTPLGPNVTVTWTTTASDADTGDTISLYVCKLNDFTGTACGGGGEWCSSINDPDGDPTCNTTTLRPDGNYTAYGFVIDNHNFEALGGAQGTDSVLTVNNVAPSISADSIYLLDTDEADNLELTVEQGETTGFKVKFTVVDDNSCENLASGNEIASAFINVRMSEITQAGCDIEAEYDANNCYPDAKTGWDPVCSQDGGSCSGTTDTDATWTCTFPLQYHADPTIASTPKAAYIWVAAVQGTDDDGLNTGLIDSTTYSNEMDTFMSYDLNTATIVYGTVAPEGDSNEQTTIVEATGNVGLDEMLSGSQLCNDYPGCADSDDIAIAQQVYNLSQGQGWGSGTALSGTPAESELNCSKTTDTGSPATKNTYWYLRIPAGQASDSYTGENTIEGKVDNETYGS